VGEERCLVVSMSYACVIISRTISPAGALLRTAPDSSHTPLLRGGRDNDLDEACVHVIDQA
jgi:hypothetical protein